MRSEKQHHGPRGARPPLFLSLDGIDGVGKSTQIRLLADWLRDAGHVVVTCRDPGSTRLGEAVRKILLDARDTPISRTAEMLLYMAARAQLVAEVIQPALAAGTIVISDRFLLANVVYQGHAGGLNVDELWQIGRIATAAVEPTLTVILDMSPEAASARITRPLDRMESQGEGFRQRLRQGFLAEAARRPQACVVIAADRDVDVVQAEIRQVVAQLLAAMGAR